MGFFGLKSKKEVEEEKQEAARQAAIEAKEEVIRNNYMSLSNLSKGSQVNFVVPFFDVFDPRFMDHGVPVSVHGSIVYSIDDMDLFHQVNKNEAFTDETFKNKLKGTVTKFVKGVVSNAPSDAQIPVLQLERKIMEISEIIHEKVTPQVERLFGVTIRQLDVTSITVNKDSRGYRELKAVTTELEKERVMAQNDVAISGLRQQHEINMQMQQMQSVDALKMQMEDQRERMRIQREGMEATQSAIIDEARDNGRASRLGQAGMLGGMGGMFGGQPQMGGMTPPPMNMGGMTPPPMQTLAQYFLNVNGQQLGPCDVNVIRQYAQQGIINQQTMVWTQGMPQWAPAASVPELAPLFAQQGMTPPPMGGGMTPPPMGGNGTPQSGPTL